MMNRNVFNKPIPKTPLKHFYIGAMLLGFSVFLILAMFQPFGTYSFGHSGKLALLAGYGIVISFTAIIVFWLLQLVFRRWLDSQAWKFHKGLIILLFILITMYYEYLFLSFDNHRKPLFYKYSSQNKWKVCPNVCLYGSDIGLVVEQKTSLQWV